MRFYTIQLGGSSGTPVSTAAAYTAADVFFGATEFNVRGLSSHSNKKGVIRAVSVVDRHAQAPEFDIILFKGTSAPTLAALNATWTLSAEDGLNVIGGIHVDTDDYLAAIPATGGNIQTAVLGNLEVPLPGDLGGSFWAAGIARGTPDYSGGAAGDLSIYFRIEEDI